MNFVKFFLGLIAAAAVLVVAGTELIRARDRKVGQQRKAEGSDRNAFIAHFAASEVDPRIPAAVYDWFQHWQAVDFPARPEDNIADVYGIVGDDVDDMILDLAGICGCGAPSMRQVADLGLPVSTTEDLVNLLQALQKQLK
jgi:hypothetical protein